MKALKRLLAGVVALGAAAGTVNVPDAALAKSAAPPVVVELFTAQGCASCKQANRLVDRLADRPDVLALTWSVDYWDYLGWKDTFAQPAFTARQKAFARRLGPRDVFTPQVVVDGAAQASGDDMADVEALIRKAQHGHRHQPKIRLLPNGRVKVGQGSTGRATADVWLVRYDPREQDVAVKAGDNKGAIVAQRNIVFQIDRLGPWTGHEVVYRAPPPEGKGLNSAVIVQGVRGGPIVGVAELKARKS